MRQQPVPGDVVVTVAIVTDVMGPPHAVPVRRNRAGGARVTCVTRLDSTYPKSEYCLSQDACACAPSHMLAWGRMDRTRRPKSRAGVAMGTTTSIERERALAWIARQMSWERTLIDLRRGSTQDATRHAA